MYRRVLAATALVGALSIAVAGCSSSGNGGSKSPASSKSASQPAMSGSGSSSGGATAASAPFGAACSAVPTSGAGSFNGMATAPVGTAASNNPVLSTLVTAVTKAGLVSTVNSAPALTVFAPTNDAFAKIPSATLNSVLANKDELTKILTYHVLAGKIMPDQLAGTHKTLEGQDLTVTGSGTDFKVGPTGTEATVVCGNVQTANAIVYIIDTVMMPPTS